MWMLLAFLLAGCSGMDPDKTVAVAGKDKISLDEYEIFLVEKTGKANLVSVSPEKREAYLKDYLDMTLVARNALNEGVGDSAWFQREVNNYANQTLAQYLHWDEMLHTLYDDAEIEKFHQRMGKTIYAKHILLRIRPGESDSVKTEKEK